MGRRLTTAQPGSLANSRGKMSEWMICNEASLIQKQLLPRSQSDADSSPKYSVSR